MEIVFLILLILLMATALGSGFPVAFALPGSAILSVLIAAICGYLFAGNVDAYFAQGGPGQWLSAGVTNLRGVYWEPERDTLIAIPLFIFMGIMLQRSKIAEDLLMTMARLFGPIPGGLGISVVFVGALLAATTGIVGATVVAMGLISLPAMLQNKYSKPLATGTIAASGTLGQIIPPSIVLIILADQLSSAADQAGTARKALYKAATGELSMPTTFDVSSTSAGEMFLGAFVPGIVLVILYMVFILIRALINPDSAPAVHSEGKYDRAFLAKVMTTLVPPLALILLVLGSIITGIATVNQAGAIGAAGAIVMAGYKLPRDNRRRYTPAIITLASLVALGFILANFTVNVKAAHTDADRLGIALAAVAVATLMLGLLWSGWRTLRCEDTMRGVVIETAKTTSLVFIILLGAAMLTAAFRGFGGEDLVREFLTGLPGGFWVQFVIVMAVIFVLGFFLDFIEIAVVVVPIVSPILLADPSANVTAVWLGVMIGLNMQTSFLTPPFGFALFYLRGVAPPSVKTTDIYRGVVAFIILQLIALAIVGMTPPLVNYLPNRISLLSETAPPPRNPRLQYCIERYVFDELDQNGQPIRDAIAKAKALDLDIMPERLAKKTSEAFDQAEQTFALIGDIRQARQALEDATPTYKPMHSQVRDIERDARKLEEPVKELETRIRRIRGDSDEDKAQREKLQARVDALKEERQALLKQIPAEWKQSHDAFVKLQKAEAKAEIVYRRAADGAYEGTANAKAIIESADALRAAADDIGDLQRDVAGMEPETAAARVKEAEDRLRDIAETNDIRSALSDARRALTGSSVDHNKASAKLDEAMRLLGGEIEWRGKAKAELLPVIAELEQAIRDNIGLRQQARLPKAQALEVASCTSHHRDISLSF